MGTAGLLDFIVCDDLPTLIWLAQLGGARAAPVAVARRRSPSGRRCSPSTSIPARPRPRSSARRSPCALRELFGELGLECFAKHSGSKGIQVYVPLNTAASTYEQTKTYSRAVAQALEKAEPDLVVSQAERRSCARARCSSTGARTTTRRRPSRSTRCAAASSRPASAPLSWDEVETLADDGDPESVRFLAAEVLERVAEHGDLFAPVLELASRSCPPLRIGPETKSKKAGDQMSTEAQDRARATWSAGDFDAIAQRIWEVGDDLIVSRVAVKEGERVLDVACGTGNAAIPAASAGGIATGVDITPSLLEDAHRNAAQPGGRRRLGRGRRPGPAVRRRLVRRHRLDLRLHVRPRPRAGRRRDRPRAQARRAVRDRRLAARGQHRPVLPDDRQVRPAAARGLSAAAAVGRARPRDRDLRADRRRRRSSRTARRTGTSTRSTRRSTSTRRSSARS